jgi:hypothetical protein
MSFRGIDDSIVFSIWQPMDKFGGEVKKFLTINSIQ